MDASDLWDANATRYLEGEVRLIWFAPTSFVKYTFLFNRYLVLATLITVAVEMCGFLGKIFTDDMLFEIFVLGSIALNALDRPTAANTPLVKALNSDGLGYFVAVTCLRILNIALASVGRPSFTILGVFRSLLRLRAVEIQAPADAPSAVRSASPFMLGTSRQPNMGIRESMYDMEGAVEELVLVKIGSNDDFDNDTGA
ncbi:predicted protein [Postia placenta Mad-698-R]|nr:predicted protein [Postia placenta Mad-698-R]